MEIKCQLDAMTMHGQNHIKFVVGYVLTPPWNASFP